jgi:hypothetical protein
MVLEMGKSLEDPHKGKKEVCYLFLQIQASEKPDTWLSLVSLCSSYGNGDMLHSYLQLKLSGLNQQKLLLLQ